MILKNVYEYEEEKKMEQFKFRFNGIFFMAIMILNLLSVADVLAGTTTVDVTKTTLYATSLVDVPITNNATNVSVGVGKIFFTLSDAIDPFTLSNTDVTLTKQDGTSVACGADAYSNNTIIAVKMGKLEYNTRYTLNLTGDIKNPGATKSLTPYSLTFTTTPNQYMVNENFEDPSLYPLNSAPVGGPFTYDLPDPNKASILSDFMILSDPNNSNNKYLHVKTGTSAVATKITSRYDFTGGVASNGIKTPFEFEARVRLNTWNSEINMGQIEGQRYCNMFMIIPGQSSFYVNNYPDPNSPSYNVKTLISSPINTSKFYKIRMVYRINNTGRYVVDGYRDDEDGNGYKLVADGARYAQKETDLSQRIDTLKPFSLNVKTTDVHAIADFDDIKIFNHVPVQLLSSSIRNTQSNVSTSTSNIALTFSTDMKPSSFTTGMIKLKNVDTSTSTNLSGTYDSSTHTYNAVIPAGTLTDNSNYQLTIGNVLSIDGYRIDGDDGYRSDGSNSINFSTGSVVPLEVNGPVTLSATPGGETLLTLAGASSIYPNIPVKKNAVGDVTVDVIVALYDNNNQLKAINYSPVTVSSITAITNVGLTGIAPDLGWHVKAFVWDKINPMKPLAVPALLADSLSASSDLKNYAPLVNKDKINIVYLGGSITQGTGASAGYKSWVGRVSSAFNRAFPGKVNNYNVGVGGTGSDLGLFRLSDDVISKNPDIVFVEFAVNDEDFVPVESQKFMEGIVRNLLKLPNPPIIEFIYTTTNQFRAFDTVHQVVADYYNIPSINLQSYMKGLVDAGKIKTTDFLGDGTHPNDYGYELYAEYIMSKLNNPSVYLRPATFVQTPLNANYYQYTGKKLLATSAVKTGNWTTSGTTLKSNTPGDTLTFTFDGPFIGLMHHIGNSYGDCEIYIDGQLQTCTRSGVTNNYLDCYYNVTDQPVMWYQNVGLTDTTHTLTIKILNSKNISSNDYNIGIDYIYVKK